MKEQPNPEEVFTQFDYNYMKKQLQNYIDPSGETEESVPSTSTDSNIDTSLPKSLGQEK